MAIAKKIREAKDQPQFNRIVLQQPVGAANKLTENNTLAANTLLKDETIASINQRLDSRLKESYAP